MVLSIDIFEKSPENVNYCLPERDAVKATANRKMIGTVAFTKRVIRRVGYKNEPLDFSLRDAAKVAKETMISRLGIQGNKIILERLDIFLKDFGYSKKAIYDARGQLFREANKGTAEKHRSIWYIDYDVPAQLKIIDTVRRWTGKYYAPDSWGGDYSPGGLSNAVSHSLYLCLVITPGYRLNDEQIKEQEYWHTYGNTRLVHPLDIFTEEQK